MTSNIESASAESFQNVETPSWKSSAVEGYESSSSGVEDVFTSQGNGSEYVPVLEIADARETSDTFSVDPQTDSFSVSFEESAQLLDLNESEKKLGRELLNALETGSYEQVKEHMKTTEDPGSLETQRAFTAVTSALATNGISARYREFEGALGGAEIKSYGQLEIDSEDGKSTITIGTDERLNTVTGPLKYSDPDTILNQFSDTKSQPPVQESPETLW